MTMKIIECDLHKSMIESELDFQSLHRSKQLAWLSLALSCLLQIQLTHWLHTNSQIEIQKPFLAQFKLISNSPNMLTVNCISTLDTVFDARHLYVPPSDKEAL